MEPIIIKKTFNLMTYLIYLKNQSISLTKWLNDTFAVIFTLTLENLLLKIVTFIF